MPAMQIYERSARDLLGAMESGELRSEEIVAALIERHRQVDSSVNAMPVINDSALEQARRIDQDRAAGRDLGALAGLPLTIKDNVDLEGFDSTLGVRSRVGRPAQRDAVLVSQLRRAGAVFLGKTNVPQALLAQETENVVYGVTKNPWNTGKVPGGSSGGEAAAVATGQSPLGIGTDIGGSLRIPAHFCGVVAFKPTLDRWSNRGSNTAIPGQELVRAQIGAIGRSVDDISALWQALPPGEQSRFDPLVPPLSPGNPAEVDLSQLRIGFVAGDAFLNPVHSVVAAARRARDVLEALGVTVVDHDPVSSRDILAVWLGAISSDGGRTLDRALQGDPVSPQLKPSRLLLRLPRPMRSAARAVLGTLGEERLSMLMEVLGEKSVHDLWGLTARRTELRLGEFDSWNRQRLDAVICPAHTVPAMNHRDSSDYTLSLAPMFRWTLLNFPAGVVPVLKVSAGEVGQYQASDRITRKTAAIDADSVGLPVAVQVVARPHCEHVLLAVMAAIEAGVKKMSDWPRTPVDPSP